MFSISLVFLSTSSLSFSSLFLSLSLCLFLCLSHYISLSLSLFLSPSLPLTLTLFLFLFSLSLCYFRHFSFSLLQVFLFGPCENVIEISYRQKILLLKTFPATKHGSVTSSRILEDSLSRVGRNIWTTVCDVTKEVYLRSFC